MSSRLSSSDFLALGFEGLFGFTEEGAQALQFFVEDGADGVFDDVFDDVVGGVVAAGGFALAAVVLEVDCAFREGFVVGGAATALFDDGEFLLERLGIGDDLFGFFAFDDGHF